MKNQMIYGKKIAIAGAISLALVWPLAVGQFAQVHIEKKLAQLSSNSFSITETQYQRGYLSSKIINKIKIEDAVLPIAALPHEYQVVTQVKHGIFGVELFSQLVVDESNKNVIQAFWGQELSPINAHFSWSLWASNELRVEIQGTDNKDKSRQFSLSPAVLQASLKNNGEVNGSLAVEQLHIKTAQENLQLHNIAFEAAGKMQDGIWLGMQQLKVGKANFIDAQKASWLLIGGQVKIQGELVKDAKQPALQDLWQINSKTVFEFNEFNEKKSNVDMKNGQLGFVFNQIDYNSLVTLAQLSDAFDVKKVNEKKVSLGLQAIDKIVQKGVELKLPMKFELEKGPVQGLVNVNLKSKEANISQNLATITEVLVGDVALSVPNSYLSQPLYEPMLVSLKEKGLLTSTPDESKLSFKINGNGILLGDGQTFAFGDLMQLFWL
ncbi:MAG: DUF945 family protein [Vibrionaceae bacterium]